MRHCFALCVLLGAAVVIAGCSAKDDLKKAAAELEKKGNTLQVNLGDGNVKIKLGDGKDAVSVGDGNVKIRIGGASSEPVVAKGTVGPFEQTGEFRAYKATTGNVVFPIPYEKAPELTLKPKLGLHDVAIVDVKTTGFKWKNNGTREFLDEPDMIFTAKGVPVAGQDEKPLTQTAEFKANSGASGQEKFAQAYAAPPHVELASKFLHKVVIPRRRLRGSSGATTAGAASSITRT